MMVAPLLQEEDGSRQPAAEARGQVGRYNVLQDGRPVLPCQRCHDGRDLSKKFAGQKAERPPAARETVASLSMEVDAPLRGLDRGCTSGKKTGDDPG